MKNLILLLFLLQVLLLGTYQGIFGSADSAFWFFLSAFIPSVLLFHKSFKKRTEEKIRNPTSTPTRLILLLLYTVGATGIILFYHHLHTQYPWDSADTSYSDIYPQVHVMVTRYLQHQPVYEAIPFEGYELYPTYLPLTWMTFIPAEWLQADYRWTPVVIGLLALLVYHYWLSKNLQNPLQAAVASLLPFVGWLSYAHYHPMEAAHHLEAMIAGFYLLLWVGLLSKNHWMQVLFLSICLLSRYSVVLWLPLWIMVQWDQDRKKSYRMVLVGFIIILFTYIIPFLSKDPSIFMQGYNYHEKAAIAEWNGFSHNYETQALKLHQGIGMAIFFYRTAPEHPNEQLQILQQWHFVLLAITVIGCGILYWWRKPDPTLFLAGSLLLYLSIFYHFIQIPYSYLFLPLLLISSTLIVFWYKKQVL